MEVIDREIHLVNVFPSNSTGGPGGNLAPVVLDAEGLTEDDMKAVARQHERESAFVFMPNPADSGVDFTLRFFVPEHEMEMCGHATVGTAWAMQSLGMVEKGKEDRGLRFSTKSGVVSTRSVKGGEGEGDGDGEMQVFVSQPQGTVEDVSSEEQIEKILSVLGITRDQLAPGRAIQNACTSRVKTAIPLKDVDFLNALQPDFSKMKSLCEELGSTGLYPYAIITGQGDRLEVEARQFPKASGYPEDAATGIAAAALTYSLEKNGLLRVGEEVVIYQGRAMGFLSRINVKLENDMCWIGGRCAWENRKS